MLRRTLKLTWFKKNRYTLTVIAIALSVAFIVSTLLLTTSIADVGDPINEAYSEVEAVVTGAEVAEADGNQPAITTPVPIDAVDALAAAGYEAVGFSTPYAQILDGSGEVGGQDQAAANIAEPWLGDSALNGFDIVAGEGPSTVGEIAVDASTAADADLAVGDTVTYVTDAGLTEAELVGIVRFGGVDNDPYVSTILVDPAEPLLASATEFRYVLVDGGDSATATQAEVTTAVADLLPNLEVQTGSSWVANQVEQIDSILGFFSTFLTVFAIVAVVVGMVIVTNTFTVSLAQRTEELALLRLVGTTKRQLLSQVVVESVLLGIAGTAIGIVGGLFGVQALGALLDFLGLNIERSNATSVSALVIGALVGIGVTVGAAVWPARKAISVAPIEALRSAELEPPSAGRRRAIAAGIFAVIGVVALIVGMVQFDSVIVGIGIGGLFAAVYAGGEVLIKAVGRLAQPALATAGPTGTVASRNLARNAGRTAAAASAVMIGVGLIAFFTLLAATVSQFAAGDAAEALTADYVVEGIGADPQPVLGPEILADLSAAEGVTQVVPVYTGTVAPQIEGGFEQSGPGGSGVVVAMSDVAALTEVYEFDVIAGSLADVDGRNVLVDESTADAIGLGVGDSVEVMTLSGPDELQVAAIATDTLPGAPPAGMVGSVGLAEDWGLATAATTAFVVADAEESVLNAAIDLPTIDVQTVDVYLDGLAANLDTVLALVYALLAVAVFIALVGVANTVSLAISERAGEIAAIRAAGASMRQIFWSLIAEFGLLALVGVLSGIGLAWVSAAGLFRALSEGQISTPGTDVVTGFVIVGVGLLGGVLAAWLPSRNAARADLLDVLRAD